MAKKTNVWKILAIIFIILFVIETLFILWIFSAGTKMVKNENICVINICNLGSEDSEYDSYYYDDYEEICYCYKDGEIAHQEIITGSFLK